MSDQFSPCTINDIAKACGTSPAKIKLFLLREELYDDAVEGDGPDAVITLESACKRVLRYFLNGEEVPIQFATLLGKSASDTDPCTDDTYLKAERISLIGLNRNRNNAIARESQGGYAFLSAPDLESDCHLWLQNLDEDAKRFLQVTDRRAERLPPVMPVLYFKPREDRPGKLTTERLKTRPVWRQALIQVRSNEGSEVHISIPGHNGADTYLWNESDDLDSGWHRARVWEAMPTDVSNFPSHNDGFIVEPLQRFRWDDDKPIDNLAAVRDDEHAVRSLIVSTAERIANYLLDATPEARTDTSLRLLFDTIEKQGTYFREAVYRQVVSILSESEASLPPEQLQVLLSTADTPTPAGIDLLYHSLVEAIDSTLDTCALDLETDGHEIWELGLASNPGSAQSFGRSSLRDGFQHLRESSAAVWIGHNLKAWDSEVLKRNGVEIEESRIWDTLCTEALLSPSRESLALDTTHKAGDDAVAAYRLFRSQVIRLLLRAHRGLPIPLDALLAPLQRQSDTVAVLQNLLRETEAFHAALWEICEGERDELLSAAATPSVIQRLQKRLDDLPASEVVHIVYSRPLRSLMEQLRNIRFAGTEDDPHQQHVRAPTEDDDLDAPQSFTAHLAAMYRQQCIAEGMPPTVGGLSPWVQSHLREHPEWIVPAAPDDESAATSKRWAVPVEAYEREDLGAPDHLIVVAPGLIEAYSTATLVHFTEDELSDFIARHHLWAQFDGVGSYCQLTDAQVSELDIANDDPFAARSTKWLQRTPRGRYVLLAHCTGTVEHLKSERPEDCTWTEVDLEDDPTAPVSCVKMGTGGRSSSLHHQRLNPDTRQRARYWTIQALLLRQLATDALDNRPVVLLTRGDDDVGDIERFFRRQDWYVPEGGTLRRRLELITASSRRLRLLVMPLERWTALMKQKLPANLHLAVDALPIKQQQALRRDDLLSEEMDLLPAEDSFETASAPSPDPAALDTDETEPAEPADEEATKQRPYALQRGLYLVAPLLRWLAYTTVTISEDADLFVLDPRVEPIRLPDGTALRSRRIPPYDAEVYATCLADAEQYFPSPVRPEDVTLPDDWEETLARIFLPEKEDGSPSTFYEFQRPYLELIMRREKDVLVELPTGSGKSVLFQGPALYHGLRHGLLTVVITPLKALMVDQARALYENGFLSSVDYVNGDLPYMEIRDIYRRVASGEIAMLYVAPERFRSRSFMTALKTRLEADGMLCYFVFDEAHCVSLWGLDFRPDFLCAVDFVNEQRRRTDLSSFPCVMLSATITEQIYEHLCSKLAHRSPQSAGRERSHP